MAEPREDGSTRDVFHCPNCGEDFEIEEHPPEQECPVCGTVCTRESCLVRGASIEGY